MSVCVCVCVVMTTGARLGWWGLIVASTYRPPPRPKRYTQVHTLSSQAIPPLHHNTNTHIYPFPPTNPPKTSKQAHASTKRRTQVLPPQNLARGLLGVRWLQGLAEGLWVGVGFDLIWGWRIGGNEWGGQGEGREGRRVFSF